MPAADLRALAEYVQADLPARLSSDEADLFLLGTGPLIVKGVSNFVRGNTQAVELKDYQQEAALRLLSRLGKYDCRRGAVSTWTYAEIRYSAQCLKMHLGGPFRVNDRTIRDYGKLAELLCRTERPRTLAGWTELQQQIPRESAMDKLTLEGVVRLFDRVAYLSELNPTTVASANVPGAPQQIDDTAILEVLTRTNVHNALAHLQPKQRERIADLIGLSDRGPMTQDALARELRIASRSLRKSVARGKYRLVNGVGLSELDELVVDAYDPEFSAEH